MKKLDGAGKRDRDTNMDGFLTELMDKSMFDGCFEYITSYLELKITTNYGDYRRSKSTNRTRSY